MCYLGIIRALSRGEERKGRALALGLPKKSKCKTLPIRLSTEGFYITRMIFTKGTYAIIPNKGYLRGKPSELQSIYLWIAEHSDEELNSFPSAQTLAEEAGVTRNTVFRYLKVMESDGVLSRKGRTREDGGQTSNMYHINLLALGGSILDSTPPSIANDTRTQPIINSINTDFAKTKSSLPKTAIRASRGLRAYDESISPEDGLTVDLDTGEVIPEKMAKPRREPKNKLALEACKYFQRACELAGASKPALTDKGYFLVLRSISNGLIDAKLLRKRMDDWFAEGHPVEKACQITHCFSDYAINAWKAINGI